MARSLEFPCKDPAQHVFVIACTRQDTRARSPEGSRFRSVLIQKP